MKYPNICGGRPLWLSILAIGLTLFSGPLAHAQSASNATAQAIMTVIETANQEQRQALATGDSSVMSDTATGAYYRQLVQINQALVDAGVTSINLTALAWGPISVNRAGATATDYETWLTTYGDGTTVETTDAHVYSLVEQNGTWLIVADLASPGGPASTPTSGVPQPTPVPTSENTSHNWAGYAATGGSFTEVSGTWIVPHPSATSSAGVGATWVGIGGVTSRDLIQAGTRDVTSGGQRQFQTWIEMLPAASQQIPVAVAPGDSVTVSIHEQGAGSGIWEISLTNNTSQESYQATVNYQSSESSAEWIEEAPVGRRGILPLDNFGSVVFSDATALENGDAINLAQSDARPITLLNSRNQVLAVASAITSDGAGFTVTRTSAPAALATGLGHATH